MKIQTPEKFAAIILKVEQFGFMTEYCSRSSLIWVYTVCLDLPVRKLRIIRVLRLHRKPEEVVDIFWKYACWHSVILYVGRNLSNQMDNQSMDLEWRTSSLPHSGASSDFAHALSRAIV